MAVVVCGWYTPNYAPWAREIEANLDALGLPHDFVCVEAQGVYWQTVTLMKAQQALNAMLRHPDKTIVLLDVDCHVLSAPAITALEDMPGDVGFYLRTRFRRAGKVRFGARSGTMVFKQTPGAYAFVRKWVELSGQAPPYSVDQDSLAVALGKTPSLVHFLDVRYCAVVGDQVSEPYVLHANAAASSVTKSADKWRRALYRNLWWVTRKMRPVKDLVHADGPSAATVEKVT
jgi:hypothetical protein